MLLFFFFSLEFVAGNDETFDVLCFLLLTIDVVDLPLRSGHPPYLMVRVDALYECTNPSNRGISLEPIVDKQQDESFLIFMLTSQKIIFACVTPKKIDARTLKTTVKKLIRLQKEKCNHTHANTLTCRKRR